MSAFVIVLWSCSVGQPLCTHPDATWSGETYADQAMAMRWVDVDRAEFERANPTREVIKFEVMTKERWEFERSSYNCSRLGGVQ